jgi:hypothetical protein
MPLLAWWMAGPDCVGREVCLDIRCGLAPDVKVAIHIPAGKTESEIGLGTEDRGAGEHRDRSGVLGVEGDGLRAELEKHLQKAKDDASTGAFASQDDGRGRNRAV